MKKVETKGWRLLMQNQLEKLQNMKVLRLTKLKLERGAEEKGLLDSGATHPMRGRRESEDVAGYEKVKVTMANGKWREKVMARMTPSGIMICEDMDVEPIVTMSSLVERLGYTINWTEMTEEGMRVTHPCKNKNRGEDHQCCLSASVEEGGTTVRMIEELGSEKKIRRLEGKALEERNWLLQLVEAHPALEDLPTTLKQGLVEFPAEDLKKITGCNRRRRRRLSRGFVVHLFAGEEEGCSLTRAFKENGGDQRMLVEVDLKREKNQDIVMGPNCRTRSVLRHYPLDVHGRNSSCEKEKVQQDEKEKFLYIVAEEMRKAMSEDEESEVKLGLEQPAAPEHKPESGRL